MFSFRPNDTESQKIFDVIFGIIAPILCLYFDPAVFRAPEDNPCDPVTGGGGVYYVYSPFAYTAIGLGVISLIAWMAVGSRIKKAAPFFAGIFFAGFLFSLAVGIAILPLSLFGIPFMGLGLLGFIPFLTALVYLRNGIKALQWAREETQYSTLARIALMVIGAAIILGAPAYVQYRYQPEEPAAVDCDYGE